MDPKRKKVLSLAVSAAVGLAGALLLYFHNTEREKILSDTVPVVVAMAKIGRNEIISDKKLAIRPFPASFVPQGAVAAKDRAALAGQRVSVGLEPGQVLLWNCLDLSATGFGLASRIREGSRAMTLAVSRASGLESMLRRGDRVDVLATFNSPGEKKRRVTRTILQNVFLLALGNDSRGGAYSTVTLQVAPSEAELLTFAEGMAELRLVLRGERDMEMAQELPAVDFDNFTQIEKNLKQDRRTNQGPRVIYE
jgi:pilus assembly protein CpaB